MLDDDNIQDSQLTALRQQVQSKLNEMSVLVTGCANADALKTSSKHLTSAIMAIKAIQRIQHATLPRKRKIPPNKNSEKQPRFFSTKKKQLRVSARLTKPSHEEVQATRFHLLSQTATVCGICLQEDDTSSNDTIEWLQCSTCDIWLHVNCAGVTSDKPPEEYICYTCSNDKQTLQ